MKKILLSMITLLSAVVINAQNVNIPDTNFKAYLVGNASINTNGDSEIQVSEATAFTGQISCISLGITDLTGIEAFSSIDYLDCSLNNLNSLDISSNTALEVLFCQHNQLLNIDVSDNSLLRFLVCHNNNLTSIDVSNNFALTNLDCQNNSITNLDVSVNSALYGMNFRDNNLSYLNVANGNNINYSYFAADNNSNLECIQVDDVAFCTANWTSIDAQSYFSLACALPCVVNIPDANFKAYLVGNTSINTNGDSEIQCSEAQSWSGIINCPNLNIMDLTGVEAFTNIQTLNCSNNDISTMDFSNNSSLVSILCYANPNLSSINLSNLNALETLNCTSTDLSSIDLSTNINLTSLTIGSNPLSSLDLSNNINLESLSISVTQISSLDISNNTLLTSLALDGMGNLNTIDLSNNIQLETLSARFLPITTLDLTSLINLEVLWCDGNSSQTALDVSDNISLTELVCSYNSMADLNVANGNNINMTKFQANSTPNLTCIQVDDTLYSVNNWNTSDFWFDANDQFSLNCNPTSVVLVNAIGVQGQNGISSITSAGGSLQMEATVLPLNANDLSYTWSVVSGTGAASIDANGLLTASADGDVIVFATANDGSGVTDSAVISISNQSVGIHNLAFEKLKVYPNPAKDVLNINAHNEEISSIRIIDCFGRVVKQFHAEQRQLDVSDILEGIYFLELSNELKRSVVKLTLQ